MNGILIIDKPSDWTSHDVIAKLRVVLGIKRIGHGGTLDPMATGVLPIFIGRATRAAEFCENADKEYIAALRPGMVTDTQDITGNVLRNSRVSVSTQEILDVIPRFIGMQKQIPPMYSAIKIGGKKLYELARRGVEVERPARDIFISDIELLDHSDNEVILRISCSKGTYIRTICHDIGEALGIGAAMSSLRRTVAGAFTLEMAHTLDEIIEASKKDGIGKYVLPVDSLFNHFPPLTLSDENAGKCINGVPISISDITNGSYRLYRTDGEFMAVANINAVGIIPPQSDEFDIINRNIV